MDNFEQHINDHTQIVKKDEVKLFLAIFNANRADLEGFNLNKDEAQPFEYATKHVVEIFKEKGFLAPKDLVPELLKKSKPDFDPSHNRNDKIILEATNKLFIEDQTTSFLHSDDIMFGLTDLYANIEGKKASFMAIDISNMGKEGRDGANTAIGRANVDLIFRRYVHIYEEEIQKINSEATVIGDRTGGDELMILAPDMSVEDLNIAREKAQIRVELLGRKLGLDALLHGKYPDDPNRAGFSVGAAPVALGQGKEYGELLVEASDGVDAHKKSEGINRREIREREGGYYSDIFDELKAPEDFHKNRDNAKDTQSIYDKIENVLRKEYGNKEYNRLINEQEKKKRPEKKKFPIFKNKYPLRDSAASRLQQAYEFAKNMDKKSAAIYLGAVDAYDAPDGASGARKANHLANDLRDKLYDLDHQDPSTPQHKGFIAHIELGNLSGLNKHLTEGLTDYVIKEVHEIIHRSLHKDIPDPTKDATSYSIYYTSGGVFKIIADGHNVSEERINKARDLIIEEFEKLNNTPIKDFFNDRDIKIPSEVKIMDDSGNPIAIGDIPHTKEDEIHGVYAIYAADELNLDKSASKNLSLISTKGATDEERQINRLKGEERRKIDDRRYRPNSDRFGKISKKERITPQSRKPKDHLKRSAENKKDSPQR